MPGSGALEKVCSFSFRSFAVVFCFELSLILQLPCFLMCSSLIAGEMRSFVVSEETT